MSISTNACAVCGYSLTAFLKGGTWHKCPKKALRAIDKAHAVGVAVEDKEPTFEERLERGFEMLAD